MLTVVLLMTTSNKRPMTRRTEARKWRYVAIRVPLRWRPLCGSVLFDEFYLFFYTLFSTRISSLASSRIRVCTFPSSQQVEDLEDLLG